MSRNIKKSTDTNRTNLALKSLENGGVFKVTMG